MVLASLAYHIVASFILPGLSYFWLGLILSFLNFKAVTKLFSVSQRFGLMRASITMKGDPNDLSMQFLSVDHKPHFDFFCLQANRITHNV